MLLWREEITLSSFGGQPMFSSSFNNPRLLTKVKCFCEVNESNKQWPSLFSIFLLQLSNRDYHVYCGSSRSEATLRFRKSAFSQDLQFCQGNKSKNFLDDAQQGDASIIVAITTIAFVFAQGYYIGISHVLRNCSLLPADEK